MKKIEVDLFQYDNLIFGKVIYTHPELIGEFNIATDGVYEIESISCPGIKPYSLMVWGSDSTVDNDVMHFKFETKQKADEWIKSIKQLLEKVNESGIRTTEINKVI